MDQSFELLEKAKKQCTSKSQNVVIILGDLNANVGSHRYEKQNQKELDHLERRSDRRKPNQQTILNGTNIVQENCGHGSPGGQCHQIYHITIN